MARDCRWGPRHSPSGDWETRDRAGYAGINVCIPAITRRRPIRPRVALSCRRYACCTNTRSCASNGRYSLRWRRQLSLSPVPASRPRPASGTTASSKGPRGTVISASNACRRRPQVAVVTAVGNSKGAPQPIQRLGPGTTAAQALLWNTPTIQTVLCLCYLQKVPGPESQ
jgi:hypothetical protein